MAPPNISVSRGRLAEKSEEHKGPMSRGQVTFWIEKYDKEEDQYNTGLEQQLGDKLRRTRVLTKGELSQIIEWKFQGRLLGRRKKILNLISDVPDEFIGKTSSESFNEHDERVRIGKLMGRYGGIRGVGPAIASVVLTFFDPKNYGVFDIHAWRELMGRQPEDLFTLDNLMRFLTKLREEAIRLQLDARLVEKAYFKKNLDESSKERHLT